MWFQQHRSRRPEVFCKKGVRKSISKLTGKPPLSEACNFVKKESPTQVFSCEFCKIFKNTFFVEHLRWMLLITFIWLECVRHLWNSGHFIENNPSFQFFLSKMCLINYSHNPMQVRVGLCMRLWVCRCIIFHKFWRCWRCLLMLNT